MDKSVTGYEANPHEFKKILAFISESRGIDLSSYRQSFVYRRLWTRINATKSNTYTGYFGLLKESPDELNSLLDALSINVSEFFRNPEVFSALRKNVLPGLFSRKEELGNRTIRAWSAGCAYGQEAYSLAILLKEELEGKAPFTVRIWGSDVDKDALEKARKAEYDSPELKNVDKEILAKYFVPRYNEVYGLKEDIRRMVSFEPRNLINDPPLKYMDIVFCRNMMIYLTRQQQEILFNKFHYSLRSKGFLVLGQVEVVWEKHLFAPVDLRRKIYQKVEKD